MNTAEEPSWVGIALFGGRMVRSPAHVALRAFQSLMGRCRDRAQLGLVNTAGPGLSDKAENKTHKVSEHPDALINTGRESGTSIG